jgi:ABC-2 type transport system permease protein
MILLKTRIWSLIIKEFRQIRRNRRLVVSLLIQPIIQVLLFGFALNPEPSGLRVGVVDECRSSESRLLISTFSESRSFKISGYYSSSEAIGRALDAGDLDIGIVIPTDFSKKLLRGQRAEAQFLLDGVNSNTATIAQGYISLLIDSMNNKISKTKEKAKAELSVTLLYNPGLKYSWFIITGTLGVIIILNGSIVAAASTIKEKEDGTIEQLLVSPALAHEIILAKVIPLFILLVGQSWVALLVGCIVFKTPVRGSLSILFTACALCVLVSVGIGTSISTFSRSQLQAQLMTIFVVPPIVMLSGAMVPLESMPEWLQALTYLNPIRHFATISRGIMLKGVGLDLLYPNLLALLLFAALLLGISIFRFNHKDTKNF